MKPHPVSFLLVFGGLVVTFLLATAVVQWLNTFPILKLALWVCLIAFWTFQLTPPRP